MRTPSELAMLASVSCVPYASASIVASVPRRIHYANKCARGRVASSATGHPGGTGPPCIRCRRDHPPRSSRDASAPFTDFEEAAFAPDNSVNDTDPEGNFVNIENINNYLQAWRVGNAGPTTEDEEIVDGDLGAPCRRVLPRKPIRQWVLSLPFAPERGVTQFPETLTLLVRILRP
jgi:hypothetical protein